MAARGGEEDGMARGDGDRRGGGRAAVAEPDAELRALAGSDAAAVLDRVRRAGEAFGRDRYADAIRILAPVHDVYPQSSTVRELWGVIRYRQGRYREAAEELEAFREFTGSVDQHPVLMDCYRATKRWDRVEDLWRELREASPSAELVAEGRIVAAGALADRGRLQDAVRLLRKAPLDPAKVRPHHLRQWYALADLAERSGDLPLARRLFQKIRVEDAEFFDVAERLAQLR
jgi:tetratricopeptide (TPR) repeat protein